MKWHIYLWTVVQWASTIKKINCVCWSRTKQILLSSNQNVTCSPLDSWKIAMTHLFKLFLTAMETKACVERQENIIFINYCVCLKCLMQIILKAKYPGFPVVCCLSARPITIVTLLNLNSKWLPRNISLLILIRCICWSASSIYIFPDP